MMVFSAAFVLSMRTSMLQYPAQSVIAV
jgi:hypothetical protein